jgi:5-methylcytosine-specific restriction protein B
MVGHSLATDEGLRAACEALGDPRTWETERTEWTRQLAATLEWVRGTDEEERRTREFQERLWEHNHVAAVGQGNIPIDRALDDPAFREWLAAKSVEPLPAPVEARLPFLTNLYEQLKEKLAPVSRAIPHLKIFRVMAALYPEAMTTVASAGMVDELTRAMGSGRRLPAVERHLWVRERLDRVLGPAAGDPKSLAERISLPWMLYARFVQATEPTEKETTVGEQTKLVPLPAARRRRGLTAIRGLFPAVLSTLEFVRDGVTRSELIDFLRASSPEAKASSLGMAINVLQSELAVIKTDGGRYVLTQRGEDVLESQDPSHLADWILTRILGADKALVELRDRGPLSRSELTAAIRSMNPGWTADFAPQAIISWLRSMGVIDSAAEYRQRLTEVGREWASRVHWQPEPLAPDPDDVLRPPIAPMAGVVALPDLATIIGAVQQSGHFPPSLIAQLHAGIWAHTRRHLAILTGLSGSG